MTLSARMRGRAHHSGPDRPANVAKLCAGPISAFLAAFDGGDGWSPRSACHPEAPDMRIAITGHVPKAAERVRRPRVVTLVPGPFQGIARGKFACRLVPRRAFASEAA
ncbi:hypothetical protein [Rhizobium sp. CSW-27]|uniref:hypothetical protein n=1 Tax=Rhizobium sp. CSW-27 TaxID=2839985 RepID=UPI001C00E515|nr:hypothetical protein [Rhizobium sp. CSW-27]MBT9369047.1 hypothetical protein [Rhizobium sp. CSW-27]